MANRSRKPTPPSSQGNQSHGNGNKRVCAKPRPKSQYRSWLWSTLAIALLLSSAGLIIAFTWFSILFIFNPAQLGWMNEFLPEWGQIPLNKSENPQSLQQIQDGLSTQQTAGESIPLDNEEGSFLLPIFQQRVNCQSDCQEIVELRVYQRAEDVEFQSQPEKSYYLATQLSITAPDESLINAALLYRDDNISLPLTKIQSLGTDVVSPGVWLALWGQRQQETNAIAYGYIIYYNPQRQNLLQLLSWQNPNGQLPKWEQVTGGGAKELVIDQTVDLEPQLTVYQVQETNFYLNPIQLAEISLKSPAFEDSGYQDALLIARNGLWTPAFEWLQFIQKQHQGDFPAAAQAQLDVIRLHSQLTKAQADMSSASPSEQVLAELIDGRWAKALQVFEASLQNAQEIASLLKADTGRLWNRTVAALRVNPTRQDVQVWATLILAAQRGEERANSWLKSQPQITPSHLSYVQGLLPQLKGEVVKPEIALNHSSQIIGAVQPITEINSSEWLQPDSNADLTLTDNQVWYRVEVSAFHDGKSWLSSPFRNLQPPNTSSAEFFWTTLGINLNSEIQIIVWNSQGEQQITSATIKAVLWQNGVLQLLAASPKIPDDDNHPLQPKPLAVTQSALEWVQPSPITLSTLYQQNPGAVEAMLPILWRSLQETGQLPVGDVPSFWQIQAQLGNWPLQMIDLTNDTQPEMVVTISADAIASLQDIILDTQKSQPKQFRPRTLILSDSGKVIYTDFKNYSQQSLTAIAWLSDSQSLALLVENAHNYSIKRWSDQNQRFE
ncbi:hypothetical protein PN465_01190 [Nodularia spumigena CS-584]|jgi:hypothetical protein|uniref:hypothetical protein n=1 Tax=Nodularia spumigena TaxID=70799 RepID=UPI00037731E5|nr:hypothetical protein [Nodularia spumigena]AHJ28215.1 hypothetical protein NSP_18820 [Nodularia spumigena CCY9414]MDB9380860.1 hypothetical protein [Nodularia spumigena CS-584]